jgi:hypothetical protein
LIPRLHLPLVEPEDVIRHLGHQERHWKAGRSAHALTHVWSRGQTLPPAIRAIFESQEDFKSAELIDGFLERQVDIGSEGRPSQTDLLAIVGLKNRIAVVAIEAKAGEPFGALVSQWLDGSETKRRRLEVLCQMLDLSAEQAMPLRYQLLHRTASAIFEARRYRTTLACMIVHDFSADRAGYVDFCAFADAIGARGIRSGVLSGALAKGGVSLHLGWANDEAPAAVTPLGYLADLRDYAVRLSGWCSRVVAWCDSRSQSESRGAD